MNVLRMRMQFTAMLPLLLVIALASTGLAYTAWTEQLTINGTATASTFNVYFSDVAVDNETDPSGVATCAAAVSWWTWTAADVTVSNMYPGFECRVRFAFSNSSSVPASVILQTLTSSLDGLVSLSDQACLNQTVAANAISAHCYLDVRIPAGATVDEGQQFTFNLQFLASQVEQVAN